MQPSSAESVVTSSRRSNSIRGPVTVIRSSVTSTSRSIRVGPPLNKVVDAVAGGSIMRPSNHLGIRAAF